MKRQTSLALAKATQLFKDMEVVALTAAFLLVAGLCTLVSCYSSVACARLRASWAFVAERSQHQEEEEEVVVFEGQREAKRETVAKAEPEALPLLVIIALTSYRFHTGFLGATWVPFIIAKEGEALVPRQQAVFMGEAKLIYGLSLCFNPMFGLLSDRLVALSHTCGRSAFLIIGIGLAGTGIYIAKVASDAVDVTWYLVGSTVWMLGEAMADTTSEAVVPELLPPKQYDLASGVRSLQAFAGCLLGLASLTVLRDVHHHWLYAAYMSMMVLCGLATVLAMRRGTCRGGAGSHDAFGLPGALLEAYIVPLKHSGNFARACLSMFCFSLGTAPIFFTLLLVRDLVGIPFKAQQQLHFGCASMTFVLFAAVSSMALATGSDSSEQAESGAEGAESTAARERKARRWNLMTLCTGVYGVAVLGYPLVGLCGSIQANLVALYAVSGCLGLAYGAVYSLVQTCTWSIIPAGVNVANWLGIAALAKVMGCGIGNFIAGIILDHFRAHSGSEGVPLLGYAVMSWFCAFCAFVSMALVRDIKRRELAHTGIGETRL